MGRTHWTALILSQAIFMFKITVLVIASNGNLLKVNFTEITSTSITLKLDFQKAEHNKSLYKMKINYNELSVSSPPDTDSCSLTAGKCILRHLTPLTIYNVIINLIYNESRKERAQYYYISTLPIQPKDHNCWWLLYVAVPSVGFVMMTMIVTTVCLLCRCCRRHKKKEKKITTTPPESTNIVVRPESISIRQWIKQILPSIPEGYERPHGVSNDAVQPINRNQDCPRKNNSPKDNKRRRAPALPPPVSSSPYGNSDISESTDWSGMSSGTPSHSQLDVMEMIKGSAANYTNTEDIDRLLGSARRMFPSM